MPPGFFEIAPPAASPWQSQRRWVGGRDAPPAPCNSVPDSLWFVPGFVPMGDFSEVLERLERYKISEKTKGPEGPCVVLAVERQPVPNTTNSAHSCLQKLLRTFAERHRISRQSIRCKWAGPSKMQASVRIRRPNRTCISIQPNDQRSSYQTPRPPPC